MTQMEKQEAIDFFSELFGGEHHIPSPLKEFGLGWSISFRNDFATFDFNLMTRFVIACHDKCFRGEVQPSASNLRMAIHKRIAREGKMQDRHPTIEQAIASYRGVELVDNFIEKAKRWDDLADKIDAMYEENSEADLGDIGEAAASAFGHLGY